MMALIHDRTPVIIGAEDWVKWLGDEPLPDASTLLTPCAAELMTMWPVDRRVGNVMNQERELAESARWDATAPSS